jgi:hypothetical protein
MRKSILRLTHSFASNRLHKIRVQEYCAQTAFCRCEAQDIRHGVFVIGEESEFPRYITGQSHLRQAVPDEVRS